jgi:hypothetical protein
MKVSEILHAQAERVGFDPEKLKELVSNPALQIEVPNEFVNAMNTGLLTVKEAKINGEIKKHFTGIALSSMDTTIAEMMDEYQLTDDVKGTIKGEESTYSKIKLFTKALADLKDQHASAAGGDKKKLVDQINDMNGQISALKTQMATELSATENKWLNKFMDTSITSHFEKYDYAMEHVPGNIQAMTARQLMEQKLAEKGGKIKYNDGKIALVSATDDALPFTIDNKPVEFNAFADSIVFDNKLAKVKGAPATPPPNTPPINNGANPNKIIAPAAKGQIQSALADLRGGSM